MALITASLALALTGCAPRNKLGTFSKGDAALNVNLPNACDRFLIPVKAPLVTHQTDGGAAYTATADALDKANGRLSTAGACRRDERQAYSAQPVKSGAK